MKVYIRTSKGDTDLLPDTVDYAKRISNIDSSINSAIKLTASGVIATKDGVSYYCWEGSDELYPSDLVFDFEKSTDDKTDTGNLALLLLPYKNGQSRFSLAIDGGYYQDLAHYRCLDTSNFPVRFSYLTVDPKPVVPSFGTWTIDGPCGYISRTSGTMFGDANVPVYQITRIA